MGKGPLESLYAPLEAWTRAESNRLGSLAGGVHNRSAIGPSKRVEPGGIEPPEPSRCRRDALPS